MPGMTPNPGQQHPERWRQDLNPNAMAGQNIGTANPHPEQGARTAYDVKSVHRRLNEIDDDRLKTISILPPGARLEQGATYLDLRDLDRGEFTARGDMEAGPENLYVPKTAVGYNLWNTLLGAEERGR